MMKKMELLMKAACAGLVLCLAGGVRAQQTVVLSADSLQRLVSSEVEWQLQGSGGRPSRLQIGGYGEVAMQRMFYSEDVARYAFPQDFTDARSHGRFDIPRFVLYLAYDFGRGWSFSTELEYEHGGGGAAIEIENEETGEYETEVEKGGEVAVEQFWIEKSWSPEANLRIGHIVVPVGITNRSHMPTEYFTVLRPEGEATILPCTWHETGVSFWGRTARWHYEVQFLAGLDAERFDNSGWIADGSVSPYEFKIANSYALAARVDNSSIRGLRLGASGYYGFNTAANSLKRDKRYTDAATGEVYDCPLVLGSADATYEGHNVLARCNIVYGHLYGSDLISAANKKLMAGSPSKRTNVAAEGLTWFVEAGYDLLSLFRAHRNPENKLYLYGHFNYYDTMYRMRGNLPAKGWSERSVVSVGLNYIPMAGLVLKGEYAVRRLNAPYNDEPTLSFGIAWSGFFKR